MKRVLIIASHPDDEVLGCGGTIAKHVDAGDEVQILIAAEGATSRDASRDVQKRKDELDALCSATKKAAKILGVRRTELLGLPDNRLDGIEQLEIIKKIEAVIDQFQPAIIYTHHGGDLNVDHRAIHNAVLTAARPLPGHKTKAIYTFETPSSTEWSSRCIDPLAFRPVRYLNIEKQLERKLEALDAYASEMREFPHPRSMEAIRALAKWRGTQVGCPAAEAFDVIREIVD